MNHAEKWLDNWISHEFGKKFDHDGQMSIEEFVWTVQFVGERRGEPIPNPPVQVAELDGFVWNETTKERTFSQLWRKHLDARARKHLSGNGFIRFSEMDEGQRRKALQEAAEAHRLVLASRQGRAKRGEHVLDMSHAVRFMKARRTAKHKPRANMRGESVSSGTCYSCARCASCFASRDAKPKCNDAEPVGG